MADYSKLKVAELKDELKKRNIPLTGLKLKQQFIDKLVELDTATNVSTKADPPADVPAKLEPQVQTDERQEEANQLRTQSTTTPGGDDVPHVKEQTASPKPANRALEATEAILPASTNTVASPPQEPAAEGKLAPAIPPSIEAPTEPKPLPETISSVIPHLAETGNSHTATPTADQREVVEDSKKRKRRSITPPPTSAEVAQKRARAVDGSPVVTKVSSPEVDEKPDPSNKPQVQEVEKEETKEIKPPLDGEAFDDGEPRAHSTKVEPREDSANTSDTGKAGPTERKNDVHFIRKASGIDARFKGLIRKDTGNMSPPPTEQAQDDDRVVEPAVHPATSSVYIRNLKRPLQATSFRSHLVSIATPPSSSPSPNIVLSLHLDSIRTHAFATFSSVSAASRVRSSLHNTRWPDEPTREPLWVDFIPDEKVEQWIQVEKEEEVRQKRTLRWEVIYDDRDGVLEAFLQEAGAPGRPSMPTQRPVEPARQDVHPDRAGMIHPDRAGLVPRDKAPSSPQAVRQPAPTSGGTGFKALDDLFPSTATKPKLYFKPVSDDLVAARKARFRDLRPVPEMRGRCIDPEMQRYSFEDGEYWVGKGPEFGYGSRGGYRGGRGGRGSSYVGRGGYHEDGWRGRRR
ncbi:MAG: hypothetical protein Q9227_004403 [Pyrenula ochraceoflavens]